MTTQAISKSWFNVDREGLAKLLQSRSMSFVVFELIQNAWDTKAKKVEVHMEKLPGTPKVKISVIDDDPEGFQNLTDAWTLFAESGKKDDPSLRGRFNMGEKFVLAVCYTACIATTTGTVVFDEKGRHVSKVKREFGSAFTGVVRMNQAQFDKVCEEVTKLIPPEGSTTYFNRTLLERGEPLATFKAQLPTVKSDDEGILRTTKRITDVELYAVKDGDEPYIYEMGIPVVPFDGKWHVNIQQKVPLNMNRDNVTPGYLKKIQVASVNHLFEHINEDEARESWVTQATSSPDIDEKAFRDLQVKKHGEDAVMHDPSDPEAGRSIVAAGGTLLYGGSFTKGQGANNRRFEVHRPAGKVAPSPKPFSLDGSPLITLDEDNWDLGVRDTVAYCKRIGEAVLDHPITVIITNDKEWPHLACYGEGELTLNLAKLGKKWFSYGVTTKMNELLIHEFAHHIAGESHLSKEFYDACCLIGARMVEIARFNRRVFSKDQ